MTTAREFLQQQSDAWATLRKLQNFDDAPFSFDEWLLANGEQCGPAIKVKGQRMKRIKMCYSNSIEAIMRREVDPAEWFYTEGVVLCNDLPLLIQHGWLTNRKGEVLDLTLRCQKDASYFGVPFKPDFVADETVRLGFYGLLSDGFTYNKDIVGKPVTRNRAWKRKSQE